MKRISFVFLVTYICRRTASHKNGEISKIPNEILYRKACRSPLSLWAKSHQEFFYLVDGGSDAGHHDDKQDMELNEEGQCGI